MDIKRPTRVEPIIATEANSIPDDTVPNNNSSESSSISVQKESTRPKPEPGPRSNTSNNIAAAFHPKMEVLRVMGTGSKLEQLLTGGADRDRRSSSRRDSAESYSNSGASAATTPTVPAASGNGADLNLPSAGASGDGEASGLSTSTSTAVPAENPPPDKYRNPRKRLLLNSLNSAGEDKAKTQDEPEKAKKLMKWKSDISSRGERSTNGPASLKVAPIRLKKYYPSAVQSAECEEFLVSLSEDNAHNDYKGEGCSDLAGGGGAGEGSNPDAFDAKLGQGKPKSDQTGIDTDQIDQLLAGSMPSQNNWKKTPKRQRKHQCSQCSKSYSSEDDLKSHELSHSKGPDAKLFECELCDKKFKWVASLKVHKKSFHGIPDGDKNGDEGEEENPEERDDKKNSVVAEISPDITTASNGTPAAENIQKEESIGGRHRVRQAGQVVEARHSKKIALEVNPAMKKPVSSADAKSKSKKVVPAQSPASTKKQVVVEPEKPETPPTPTPGRSALRRNIQRPKWLTDTDLVTDYEFPSGTKSMRMGSTTSSPSTASSVSVSSSSSTKTVKSDTRRSSSVEVSKEKQSGTDSSKKEKHPAGDSSAKKDKQSSVTEPLKKDKQPVADADSTRKVKQSPPPPVSANSLKKRKSPVRPSRGSIRKAKARPKMEGTNVGIEAEKEAKAEAGTEEAVATIANSSPNTRQKEKGSAEVISPTKQLQAKILTLSLSTIAESSAASKNATSRKRPSADTGTTGSQSKPMDKKARKSDANSNAESEPQGESKVRATAKQTNHSGVVQSESADPNSVNKSRLDRSSRRCIISDKDLYDAISKLPHECQGVYRSNVPFPPIKLAEKEPGRDKVASCISGNIESFVTSDSKKTVETEGGVVQLERKNSGDANAQGKYSSAKQSETSDGIVGGQNEGTVKNQIEGLEGGSEFTSPFVNCDGISFADIAGSGKTEQEKKKNDQEQVEIKVKEEEVTSENQVQNTLPIELRAVENVEEGTVEADSKAKTSLVGKSLAELPDTPASTNTNDEEMPVLKPETSSAPVLKNASRARPGPRSPSDKSKSLDDHEEESSNSNHSANPLEAPVLSSSNEFGTIAKHSPVAEDENRMTSMSRALSNELSDTAAELDKLPLMEDEDNVIHRRRDRSDSLSMRSCGSGSPSEKLRALEDTNTIACTKDKDIFMDNDECLDDDDEEEEEDDSDSDTDTLFSELSELAAQVSEKTDAVQFKEDCLRFIETKVSANSMWAIRKELKRLKKEKKYFRFGKLSPLAAGLMHDIFCQTLD